jgi:hypothetical protein
MHIHGIDLSELDPLTTIVEQEVRRAFDDRGITAPALSDLLRDTHEHLSPIPMRRPFTGACGTALSDHPSMSTKSVHAESWGAGPGSSIERCIDPRSLDEPVIVEVPDHGRANLQRALDFFQVDDVPGLSQVLDVADRLLVGRRPRRRMTLPTLDLYAWLLAWRAA